MPGAQDDVAFLLRMKAVREKASVARQVQASPQRSRQLDPAQLQEAARSRWPNRIDLLRSLIATYQARSEELGVSVDLDEVIRLRTAIPDIVVRFSRKDGRLATRVLFRMTRDGRTHCRIQQISGIIQSNLNRDDRLIDMTEQNLKPLFKAIVQILMVPR